MSLRDSFKKGYVSTRFNVGDRVNVPKRYFAKSDLPENQQHYETMTHFSGTLISKGPYCA